MADHGEGGRCAIFLTKEIQEEVIRGQTPNYLRISCRQNIPMFDFPADVLAAFCCSNVGALH